MLSTTLYVILDMVVRLVTLLLTLGLQVFARDVGTAPPYGAVKVVGVNVPIQLQSDGQELTINPGDYLVGDLNGVVVLPQDQVKKALPLMAKQGEADAKMAVAIKEGMPFTEASRKFRI